MDAVQIFLKAVQYDDINELTEAFNKFKVSKNKDVKREKLVVYTEHTNTIHLRMPDVRNASNAAKEQAASYIHFATRVLGLDSSKVRVHFDETLGNTCRMTNPVRIALTNMSSAAVSISGLTGSRTFDLGRFKGPAQSYLVAIRLLNVKASLYKPVQRKKACNLAKLKDTLDHLLGLKEPGVLDFAKNFVRQILAIASTRKGALPASYYVATKSENNVTSQEGVLSKLGYTPIVPSVNKVIKIATAIISCDANGKATKAAFRDKKDTTELNRDSANTMGVKLLLPMISEDGKTAFAKQTQHPEKFLTESARKFYNENALYVAESNKAYAILSAGQNDKQTSTKPKHVQNALGKAHRKIATELPFQDRDGNLYPSYMSVPSNLRHHLESLLKRKRSRGKRGLVDEDGVDKEGIPTGIPPLDLASLQDQMSIGSSSSSESSASTAKPKKQKKKKKRRKSRSDKVKT
jgi:hypothetical protein